ncbi:3'-5' exoribonuclease YhaM family protein [Granulicella cerasi]|uniref:3'-5' exoribonuclease YhaM family protein n=1 Tax=Granulicella cerasi TaxID=741063 RepID=A0ABW1Z6T4_9BACT|nr:HD domain-containing protein [Granulicella cerasi]
MKDFFISDAARFENQAITSYFVLAAISQRDRKGGGTYLAITLADKTGSFEARMWDDFADVIASCSEGCYVKAQGTVSKYQGKFQITLQKLRSAAESEIDSADFQPTTQYDIAEMDAELRGYVAAFTNQHLQRLVLSFLDDPEIGPLFRVAPAAKRLHHAWIGGLLEHVLYLVRVCRATVPFYPEVDPDLLLTGAILHDMGKVRELSWKTNFGYTIEGQLIGHISIGASMIAEKIAQLNAEPGAEPFPLRLRIVLEHMILAHHGKLEFGSPKLPMTPEALLLSTLDDLEAKFQTLRSEFAASRSAGKKVDETTDWVRSMDRALFNSQAFVAEEAAASLRPERTVEPEPEATISLFDL